MRRSMVRWALVGLCTLMILQAGLSAQVLQQVPADAVMVVKVRNLEETNAKLAALMERWGVSALSPEMADPLAMARQQFDLNAGLNEQGDAALVLLNSDRVVVLVPVQDYQTFVQNFQEATAQGDVTQVLMNGQNAYVAQWGDYAAIAEEQETVAQKPTSALQVTGLAADQLDQRDMVLYVNVPAMRERAIANLEHGRQEMMRSMDKAAASPHSTTQQKAQLPAARAMMNKMIDGLEQALREGEAAAVAMSFTEDGVESTTVLQFGAQTQIGGILSRMQNTDQPLLTGLPDAKYLLVLGAKIDPTAANLIVDNLLVPAMSMMQTATSGQPATQQYVQAIRQMVTASQVQAGGLVAPTGSILQSGIVQILSVYTGDANAIAQAQQMMIEAQKQFLSAMGPEAGQVAISFTPKAATIEGVSLDSYQTTFNMQPKTPQEMQAAQMLSVLYGPGGMNILTGPVDDQHFLAASAGNKELAASAIRAIRAGEAPLAARANFQAVSQHLPKQRLMEVYVPLDNIASTAANAAQQFGMPVPLQIPPDLSPVGMTVATEGPVVRIDGFLPSDTVQNLVSAGMQAFMQMQAPPPPRSPRTQTRPVP